MKRNWVRGASCIPLLLAASPALAQQGVWQTVGIGDCPGRDVASSRGFVPDPVRCDPASAGHTAVCWKDGCTYKNVPTAQCTGGANPGNMYTCQPSGQVSPTAAGGKGLDFQVTCTNCGHKQVDLGEHDFCALTGFVVGGFNSRCNVARSGSRWTLVATDPGPPDPWQGESQECSASCFDARR